MDDCLLHRINRNIRGLVLGAVCGIMAMQAGATVTLTNSGTSNLGHAVSFRADLSISGNTLTLVLSNVSPVSSTAPNDTLGSFYWDIIGPGNTRPALTLNSAVGNVYLGDKNNPDPLVTANANINAVSSGVGWVFRGDLNPALNPFFGFGVGGVGNNNLIPNNFNGNLTDGVDYCIVRGDVTTQNLDGTDLVRDWATFTFTGVSGFTESEIVAHGAFGMGTAPDSMMQALLVPEPGSAVMMGLSLLVLLGCGQARR